MNVGSDKNVKEKCGEIAEGEFGIHLPPGHRNSPNKGDPMTIKRYRYRLLRHFLRVFKVILSLVLLLIEIIKRLNDF